MGCFARQRASHARKLLLIALVASATGAYGQGLTVAAGVAGANDKVKERLQADTQAAAKSLTLKDQWRAAASRTGNGSTSLGAALGAGSADELQLAAAPRAYSALDGAARLGPPLDQGACKTCTAIAGRVCWWAPGGTAGLPSTPPPPSPPPAGPSHHGGIGRGGERPAPAWPKPRGGAVGR
jgi:hypothetical protein